MPITRPKGSPKPPGSGRKPGTQNKAPTVREILAGLNFDPVEYLVKLLPELSPDSRAKTTLALLPYVHAQYKPVDDTEPKPAAISVNITTESLLEQAQRNRKLNE